jgi:hypothetical protein
MNRLKEENQIADKNRETVKVYCKYCGHSQVIPCQLDKKICSYCHRLIANNSKAHFDYKLRKLLKESEQNDNG